MRFDTMQLFTFETAAASIAKRASVPHVNDTKDIYPFDLIKTEKLLPMNETANLAQSSIE